jgi:hypothetical protein
MHLGSIEASAAIAVATKDITGICAGTTIMTMDGELPVEHLSVGDRVITRDAGMSVLREVRVADVEIACIAIKAGSLGHTRPDRDMLVAPGALIHIRDWRAEALFGQRQATVPARRLIDGEYVAETAKARVRIFDLIFDHQHIVYADGVEMASAAV